MKLDLNGHRALVCGASEGIGRAAAMALAAQGAQVTVMARRVQALDEVVSTLPGADHDRVAVDFDDPAALEGVIRDQVAQRGYTILINNAGGPPGGPIAEARAEDFLAAYHRHLLASHLLAQALLPGMRARGHGRIVNVVSTSVYEPIPGLGVSNTTRAAVAGWAKTLAREVAAQGITVNNVLPGFTRTGRLDSLLRARADKAGVSVEDMERQFLAQVPAGRFAEPEEIADAIAFLASPAAGYITGVSLAVDGGRMHTI